MSTAKNPQAMQSFADLLGMDADTLAHSIRNHLHHTLAKDKASVTLHDWFTALAYAVRDRLAERWIATQYRYKTQDLKQVYYLSMEFLLGRLLTNNLLNLDLHAICTEILQTFALNPDEIYDIEHDPALGNGGLGRLAACFLDSLATLNLPAGGYGIRYEFGMFAQKIRHGYQVEHPDNWLMHGNPWEFPRPEIIYQVNFGGNLVEYVAENGEKVYAWEEAEHVMAMAYDIPIAGYGNNTVNNLRLWSAKSSSDFDLQYFNQGDYIRAVEDKNRSEILSKVLYPSDSTLMGRELRLRQEYFFVAASLQDILQPYLRGERDIHNLADYVVIQLNDTHPALAIPELMRWLLDRFHLAWKEAWQITVNTFAYTNHTLLPEALETWSISLFEKLLPRHLQIIYDINHYFLIDVRRRYPGDVDVLRRMSIIGEEGEKYVRMSSLAVVGSHKVNGVAALHTVLMQNTIFADFARFFPNRFVNKTNGITPRRWLHEANPKLSDLITKTIGKQWLTDLDELRKLIPLADDVNFNTAFFNIKVQNKQQLALFIKKQCGLQLELNSLFDVQIKRMHEYKRQLLNLLYVITRYNRIHRAPHAPIVPRTVIFAGKAAPGYALAKLIIKLINDVADTVNHDPVIGDKLKVVFLPNYDVSNAMRIIPAAELSQQISTAGTEASGTGNMKLALNGALTIGTLDGANIEIREEVGAENMFIFGLTAEQARQLRQSGYQPWDYYHAQPELKQVLDMISGGYFSPEEPQRFKPIVDALTVYGDRYLLLADYADYVQCQERVDSLYQQPSAWIQRAILNTAQMGKFSADRTIREYAHDIWKIQPCG